MNRSDAVKLVKKISEEILVTPYKTDAQRDAIQASRYRLIQNKAKKIAHSVEE